MIIKFPKKLIEHSRDFHRYYDTHIMYVHDIFKNSSSESFHIIFIEPKFLHKTKFEIFINEIPVMFDFSDHLDVLEDLSSYKAIFKFHWNEERHGHIKNMFPFSPISFYNWKDFAKISTNINYKAKGKILNKQIPHANALERRNFVQSELLKKFPTETDISVVDQNTFFTAINDCLVSVCVPGARNNMLDRGQLQYMAFGCCTISPKLITKLSFNKELIPDVHYIECDENYSNLEDKINYCKENSNKCIEIGMNAKKLFLETSIPDQQVQWILSKIK